jgi:putative colanic acid polymerase
MSFAKIITNFQSKLSLDNNFIQTLTIVSAICLLNLEIARPLNYPLTVAPFFLLWFLWTFFQPTKLSRGNSYLILALLILPLANLIQVPTEQAKLIHFLKTYSLWCFSITCVMVSIRSSIRKLTFSIEKMAKLSLVVITILLLLQVTFVRAFNDDTLFNILGGHLYGGYPQLNRFIGPGIVRPLGFYFEPSFCALVMIALMSILIIRNELFSKSGLIGAVGITVTTSLFGFGALAILLSAYGFGKIKCIKKIRNVTHIRIPLVWVASWGAFTLLYWNLNSGVASHAGVASRISEVLINGSSVHYRLISPLYAIRDVLISYPLGLPFGQLDYIMPSYKMLNGISVTSSVDNGIYVLILYFGWLAVTALLICVWLIWRALNTGKIEFAILLLYLLLSLSVTGMIFSPEYTALLVLVIYQFRVKTEIMNKPAQSYMK